MIQRIQSLYLLLVAVLGIVLYFVPLVSLVPVQEGANPAVYHISVMNASIFTEGATSVLTNFWFLIALNLAVITLAAFIIFKFKNRPLQIKMGQLLVLLFLGFIIAFVYDVEMVRRTAGESHNVTFSVFSAVPVIQILLIRMAVRAIRKDEELVRSADRLR